MLAARARGAIVTRWNAVFVAALRSVTVRVTLYVPFTANVDENVDSVPLAGLPPVTAHAYVYGDVPPETVEPKLTAVFTVPEVGPVMETVRGSGEIVTRRNAIFETLFRSVTVRVTLY